MKLKTILLDPKTVLGGVISGFMIGLFAKPLGQALMPIGTLYIAFLSMCLLPILITAVVTGIAGLLRDPKTRVLFRRMALYYGVGLMLALHRRHCHRPAVGTRQKPGARSRGRTSSYHALSPVPALSTRAGRRRRCVPDWSRAES